MANHHHLSITFTIIFTAILLTPLGSSSSPFPINVWPKPTKFLWPTPQSTLLSPNFTIITTTTTTSRPLSAAIRRYEDQITTTAHHPITQPTLPLTTTTLTTLILTISSPSTPLSHLTNESYTLTIPTAGASVITAATTWGAMRGLETFSQLVYGWPAMVGSGIEVEDWPLFGHRGLMLDTSRNYYGMDDLKRLIRALSMNKMNVFHWHVTDSHSFPLVVESEPELSRKGAYEAEMVYTTADVAELVEYGMDFGVRVVPEIDMPAHTGSWAEAYPEIVTCANMFWWPANAEWEDRLAAEPGTGQLNPLNPKTYEVVKNVLRDVIAMFPDQLYHAGADEVTPNCWKTDPTIQKYLENNGTLSQVLETFVNNTLPYILSLNRTVVYWEDVLLDANVNVSASLLPKEHVILQTWNDGPNNTKRIVQAGYQAIVSSSDFYYLDCGHGDFLGNDSEFNQPPGWVDTKNGGSWCGPFKNWQTIYNYDITYNLTVEESKLVLGGEVALWSEQADGTVLDSRIWPRTSAMAESLWSGNRDETGNKRYAEATDRLNEWRYTMVSRGIGAEPIQPLWCIRNPGMCNTVHPF